MKRFIYYGALTFIVFLIAFKTGWHGRLRWGPAMSWEEVAGALPFIAYFAVGIGFYALIRPWIRKALGRDDDDPTEPAEISYSNTPGDTLLDTRRFERVSMNRVARTLILFSVLVFVTSTYWVLAHINAAVNDVFDFAAQYLFLPALALSLFINWRYIPNWTHSNERLANLLKRLGRTGVVLGLFGLLFVQASSITMLVNAYLGHQEEVVMDGIVSSKETSQCDGLPGSECSMYGKMYFIEVKENASENRLKMRVTHQVYENTKLAGPVRVRVMKGSLGIRYVFANNI
ncbi:MAG TPA: hypothetical protein VK138_08300 [Acidiferrobacterales bacterium]|nr:hypothetical protein [Acidiferrobacterales bacterium]